MKEELIDIIKSKGYWRINFQPVSKPKEFTLAECNALIEKNSVKLRGWYYPFYGYGDADNHGFENHNNFRQGWIDSTEFKEFWRMYKSSQFLHYVAVTEDWWTPQNRAERFSQVAEEQPKSFLNFVGSLNYFVTEVYEFLSRLYNSGLYEEGVIVSISLHNTKGRRLSNFDFSRHLSRAYITQEDTIEFKKTYTPEDLAKSPKDLAIDPIVHIYEQFNFNDISVQQVIKVDQDTLYGYRTSRLQ